MQTPWDVTLRALADAQHPVQGARPADVAAYLPIVQPVARVRTALQAAVREGLAEELEADPFRIKTRALQRLYSTN